MVPKFFLLVVGFLRGACEKLSVLKLKPNATNKIDPELATASRPLSLSFWGLSIAHALHGLVTRHEEEFLVGGLAVWWPRSCLGGCVPRARLSRFGVCGACVSLLVQKGLCVWCGWSKEGRKALFGFVETLSQRTLEWHVVLSPCGSFEQFSESTQK